MNRRIARWALVPLVFSAAVCGPAALARSAPLTAPVTTAAPPAASCVVLPHPDGVAGQKAVQLVGFTGKVDVKETSGKFTQTLQDVKATITFVVPDGTYVATPATGPQVSCTPAGGTTQENPEGQTAPEQFRQGFRQGFQDLRQDCGKKPQQGVAPVDPNWEKGYTAGAAAATKQFCR
ncbi:hypothetical protein [Streptomyces sp. NPDC051577]|uniref:hypothetical protein n=1 Tax=Streptomyces sp. NPDC051577 TaxID=3155166 RepID=UPI0034169DAF